MDELEFLTWRLKRVRGWAIVGWTVASLMTIVALSAGVVLGSQMYAGAPKPAPSAALAAPREVTLAEAMKAAAADLGVERPTGSGDGQAMEELRWVYATLLGEGRLIVANRRFADISRKFAVKLSAEHREAWLAGAMKEWHSYYRRPSATPIERVAGIVVNTIRPNETELIECVYNLTQDPVRRMECVALWDQHENERLAYDMRLWEQKMAGASIQMAPPLRRPLRVWSLSER